MVDYSKWNAIDDSDDEGADKKPRVHRFDGPQQVTIGGPNREVHVAPSSKEAEGQDEMDCDDDEPVEPPDDFDESRPGVDRREDVLNCRGVAERAFQAGDFAEAVRLLEKAMKFGGASCPGTEDMLAAARRKLQPAAADQSKVAQAEPQQRNGGTVEGRYSWNQTRETVDVNVFVPAATKAKTVQVDVAETRVCIKVAGTKVLDGEFDTKVEPEEDPDWEVRDLDGQRVVRLTVRKAKVPGGLSVIVWWKRFLKGDPGIEVSDIEDRKKDKAESFKKAWQEAHVSFKEKVVNREKINIDDLGAADDMMQD